MMRTKDETAAWLADFHYEIEPGIQAIYRLSAGDDVEQKRDEPIKLLEVNQDAVEAGIMPLHFDKAPQRDVYYSSIIVEVSPTEFQQIENGELSLPNDWSYSVPFPKPNGEEPVGRLVHGRRS
ncbi:MAG: hypothetical protein ACRC1K_18035 [Planctomycetia bacterium]